MATRAFLSAPGAAPESIQPVRARSDGSSTTLKITQALFLSKEAWIQNILVFLAARTSVLGALHPFGPALFAAVLIAGHRRRAVAAAFSLVAGAASALPWHETFAVAAAAFAALVAVRPSRQEDWAWSGRSQGERPASPSAGHEVRSEQLPGRRARKERAQSGRAARRAFGIALLFAAARAVPAFAAGATWADAISVAVEAPLIALLTLIALPAAAAARWYGGTVRHDRKTLIALGFLVAVAGSGLAEIGWNAFRADELWNRWVTLVAALVGGAAGGAAMGTAIGVFSSLSGRLPLGGLGLYGVAGLFAGVFGRKGKTGAAIGYVLGQMIVAPNASGPEEIILGAAHTGLALVLLSLTPNRWIARMRRNVPGSEAQVEIQLAREARLREAINERLRQIGSVFSELAEVFAQGKGDAGPKAWDEEGIHSLIEQVWERQCKACSGFKECWQDQFYQSYWETVDLVSAAERRGAIGPEDLSPGFRRRCYREKDFAGALNRALQVYRGHKSRAAGIDVVPEQLKGAARLVENVAGQVKLDTSRAEELEGLIRDELSIRGVEFEDVRVRIQGDRADVEVEYAGECDGYGSCSIPLLHAVEHVIGERYTCEPECRSPVESVCRVRLVPEPPTVLEVKWARLAKGATPVSGDACAKFDLGGGKVALALSDGMGAGGRAALDSRAAVGLLEKMMRAGFDREFATRTVNAALLARSQEESFATLDLAVVDQFTGDVEFLKVGASPTFIKRASGVEIVRSSSLPVGILSDIDVSPEATRLRVGDALVMMTDGVLDSLPHRADKEEWIARILRRAESSSPEDLVRLLVDRAVQLGGGEAKDDITVLVAQLQYRLRLDSEEPAGYGAAGWSESWGTELPDGSEEYASAAL